MSKAARVLNITQPALTRNIRLLEHNLNVSLFDRQSSGVQLTAYGQMLARRVRVMLLEFEQAKSEIESFKEGRRGTIRIGATPAWAIVYVPEAISAARKELEEVNFTIVGGSSRPLLALLQEGKIDLACLTLDAPAGPGIVTESLLLMERVVVCNAQHPLAALQSVPAKVLLDYSWAQMKNDDLTVSRLGAYFSAFDLDPPRMAIECDSNLSMLSILRSTDCLGTVPKVIAPHPICEGLVVLPIQGSLWRYECGIAYRREDTPPKLLHAFISYIRAYLLSEFGSSRP